MMRTRADDVLALVEALSHEPPIAARWQDLTPTLRVALLAQSAREENLTHPEALDIAATVIDELPGVPGPLRWKYDGGRGALLDSRERIAGYWHPPAERQVEAAAIEAAAELIHARYPRAADELLRIAKAVRKGERP